MRLLMIVLALVLAGAAAAESVKVGSYNVTFNINQPHENTLKIRENISEITIKTFEGKIYVAVVEGRDKADFEDDLSDFIKNSGGNALQEPIQIDGTEGVIAIVSGDSEGYYTGHILDDNALVEISSHVPFYDTADFLRSLHINRENS